MFGPRLLLVAAAALLPGQALAVGVFLNGTKVDGMLTGTKMEKCGVEFDAKGNVLLNCPGIKLETSGGDAAAAGKVAGETPTLTRKYFLVTEQAVQGNAEFDIDLFINSKWIRTLKNDEEQIVTEITRHVVPGKNAVTFTARKRKGEAARRSFSPEHFFRVIIGEGNESADRVMIDNPVVTFKRTAAETEDVTEQFSLVTR